MEPATAMQTLLTNVGSVITSSVTWFGSISSALVANEVFQIVLALVILILLFTLLVNLVGKIRARAKSN